MVYLSGNQPYSSYRKLGITMLPAVSYGKCKDKNPILIIIIGTLTMY